MTSIVFLSSNRSQARTNQNARITWFIVQRVIETLVKVWKNSKKLWKHSPASRVPTAFLVLSNFQTCFLFLKKGGLRKCIRAFKCIQQSFVFTVSSEDSPSSTASIKLMTYLRYGKISYASNDVLTWDGSWQPPASEEKRLKQQWKSYRLKKLTISVNETGEIKEVNVSSPTLGDYCSIS